MDRRIETAARLSEAGYEVRIRVDPLVPVPDWPQQYSHLLDEVFSRFTPARVTFGSLRGLQSTINESPDKSWTVYLRERSNWGKKVEFQVRYEMYKELIHRLKTEYGYTSVSFCKETVAMWDKLGLDHRQIRCNCLW